MASFKDIVQQAPKKDAFDDGAVWTLRSMLEALQRWVLDSHDSVEDDTVTDLQASFGERLTVHTLFDIHHGSDESCSAEVLCLDGNAVLLYKRIGDRSDYSDGLTVLDASLARGILAALVESRTKAAFSRMEDQQPSTSPEELLWSGTQYLVPLSTSVFFVGSPKWAYGFKQAFDSHRAYLVDPEGQLVRVKAFGKWANKLQSWESRKDTHLATVLTEQGEVELDARNVLFTLTDDANELKAVVAELCKPCSWRVTKLECADGRDDAFVQIVQHVKGQTFCGFASIHFKDKATAQAVQARFSEPQLGRYGRQISSLDEYRDHIEPQFSMNLQDE